MNKQEDMQHVSTSVHQHLYASPQLAPSILGRTMGVFILGAVAVAAAAVMSDWSGASRAGAATVVTTSTSMPTVQLERVVIRPSAQQLAEVEQIRQARAASGAVPLATSAASTNVAAGRF